MTPKKNYPFASLEQLYSDFASHFRQYVSHNGTLEKKNKFKNEMRLLALLNLFLKDQLKNDT